MLEDVAGSRTFSTASPDSVMSVTCAQCEPALIREEHRAPMANLPILVFSGKCQLPCTVLGSKHKLHLWMSTSVGCRSARSARKDKNREMVCGHHLQNHYFIGVVLLIASHFHLLSVPFVQQQVKLIHNQCCFLTGQVDFTEV